MKTRTKPLPHHFASARKGGISGYDPSMKPERIEWHKPQTMDSNRQDLPALMQQLHELPFEYLDGEGIDFEPYPTFLSGQGTCDWLRAWTGNVTLEDVPYLIFGQDGTGGYAALWLIRVDSDLLSQPVVFFGSEGELGVIARNFSDYLWLLASGHGPYEAVAHPDDQVPADATFLAFASTHATTPQSPPGEITARAAAEFPDFETNIRSLCQ